MRSLTDKQISEIRELYKSGLYNQRELSEIYNCHPTTISLWIPETSPNREYKIHSKRERKTVCIKCGISIAIHPRCPICTILLHNIQCDCD